MTSKLTVADSVRALAIQYQAVIDAADMLESIGKLEQTEAELKKATEVASKQLDGVRGMVAGANDELTKINADIDAALDAEAQKLLSMRQQAESDASSIKVAAKAAADKVLAAAEGKAAAIVADAEAQASALNTAVAANQSTLIDLLSQVNQRQAELDVIESKLAKAKDGLRKLIEG